jgi:drug/metabolite transporter (DMT)-like permease
MNHRMSTSEGGGTGGGPPAGPGQGRAGLGGGVLAGTAMVLAYNVLSATKEVVSGHLIQTLSPFALACVAFALVAAVFHVAARARGRAAYRAPFAARPDLLWLNLMTLGAWLGFFYSVRYLEPAIVSAVMVGFGPAVMVAVSPLWYRKARIGAGETAASFGILLATLYLILVSSSGMSAMGELTGEALAKGGLSAAVGSVAMVGATVFSKRVSDAGSSPAAIMAHRFYALIPASLALALLDGGFDERLVESWPVVVGITVAGVLVPLWSLQNGIRRLPPSRVVIIISTAPAFTYVIQYLDPRLAQSVEVLPGILAICALAALSGLKGAAPRPAGAGDRGGRPA